ncbi:hypothetical protein SADUNF_Sadunf03G0118600 [Salix dunnii]|uniref:Uncharacterized protein n=1 Tax=Salix dunnii TaxID=1413687 RepID=A0A835TDS0_9ROSI|nr:hypothetical protein SADUNF_Sadunf03G0118600 [Salix dunnii]
MHKHVKSGNWRAVRFSIAAIIMESLSHFKLELARGVDCGGERKMKLPPELGYGMREAWCKGGSCIIPPDSVHLLLFFFMS